MPFCINASLNSPDSLHISELLIPQVACDRALTESAFIYTPSSTNHVTVQAHRVENDSSAPISAKDYMALMSLCLTFGGAVN